MPATDPFPQPSWELEAPRITADEIAHATDPNWPRVQGYDILGVLGSGGMGTVYRAFDSRCRRQVALKTINRAGAAALLRFKREFRTLLDVAHPNLVTLHELICDGQNWFLTMELLDGVDFLRYLKADASASFARERPSSLPGCSVCDGETEVATAVKLTSLDTEKTIESASAGRPAAARPLRGDAEPPLRRRSAAL